MYCLKYKYWMMWASTVYRRLSECNRSSCYSLNDIWCSSIVLQSSLLKLAAAAGVESWDFMWLKLQIAIAIRVVDKHGGYAIATIDQPGRYLSWCSSMVSQSSVRANLSSGVKLSMAIKKCTSCVHSTRLNSPGRWYTDCGTPGSLNKIMDW